MEPTRNYEGYLDSTLPSIFETDKKVIGKMAMVSSEYRELARSEVAHHINSGTSSPYDFNIHSIEQLIDYLGPESCKMINKLPSFLHVPFNTVFLIKPFEKNIFPSNEIKEAVVLNQSFFNKHPNLEIFSCEQLSEELRGRIKVFNISMYPEHCNWTLDFNFLAPYPNLKFLVLNAGAIKDLSPLKSLTNLVNIELSNCNTKKYNALSSMTQLKGLALRDSKKLKDLNFVETLNNLQTLAVTGCAVTDISALKNLTSLQILNLENCPVKDLTPLSSLTKLAGLNLCGTSIKDIGPLKILGGSEYHLRKLDLHGCEIEDLTALYPLQGVIYVSQKSMSAIFRMFRVNQIKYKESWQDDQLVLFRDNQIVTTDRIEIPRITT